MRRRAGEEAGHRAVKEERDKHRQPQLMPPEAKNQGARDDEKRGMPAGLEPALGVAPPRELAQPPLFHRAAIPIDAQRLPNFGEGLVSHSGTFR